MHTVVPLALEHEAALADFLADFDRAGEQEVPAYFAKRSWPHAECVQRIASWARGEDHAASWVPNTTGFLFDGASLVGVVNVRHTLTPKLREYAGNIGFSVRPSARRQGHGHRLMAWGLGQCGSLGRDRALVSCEPTNLGSKRIIEGCGGVLERRYFNSEYRRDVLLYWIPLNR
jgi:predicted acetyltransferase